MLDKVRRIQTPSHTNQTKILKLLILENSVIGRTQKYTANVELWQGKNVKTWCTC